jgi:Flp pilus assembly protein CpaB
MLNIENKKQLATILLAVGLGLVAAFLTSQYVQTSITREVGGIAKQSRQEAASLQKELQITQNELKKIIQQQALLEKQIKEQPKVIQQVVQPFGAKQPVDQTAFSVITPPGKRAVTVQIDSLAAVGGLLSPGDFVDVLARLKIPEEEGEGEKKKTKVNEVTTILFQDIQVLAVGVNFKPTGGAEVYQAQQQQRVLNVTLAVTPEEAGLLSFVQTNGTLQLSLRSPAEQGRQALQVASWGALSDYVLDRQGTELSVPKEKSGEESEKKGDSEKKVEEEKSPIQIFRGGKELGL